jgi:acyl carrier protein
MTQVHYKAKIHQHIVSKFPLAKKRGIRDTDSLLQGGVIDSLGILDLVHYLEAEFGLHITDDELLPENFDSVDTIAKFVSTKTIARKPGQNEG